MGWRFGAGSIKTNVVGRLFNLIEYLASYNLSPSDTSVIFTLRWKLHSSAISLNNYPFWPKLCYPTKSSDPNLVMSNNQSLTNKLFVLRSCQDMNLASLWFYFLFVDRVPVMICKTFCDGIRLEWAGTWTYQKNIQKYCCPLQSCQYTPHFQYHWGNICPSY